jgi:hypothetical protein
MTWLIWALMTVVTWGVYGVLLHAGQVAMGDPVHARYKAFLFVGIAYFVTAVVAPLVVLKLNGATLGFPARGAWLSLIAGVTGAAGAFGVLLTFGAKGSPTLHPPAGGLAALRWQFVLGIALAALGGCLVTFYKPGPPPVARTEVVASVPERGPGS